MSNPTHVVVKVRETDEVLAWWPLVEFAGVEGWTEDRAWTEAIALSEQGGTLPNGYSRNMAAYATLQEGKWIV